VKKSGRYKVTWDIKARFSLLEICDYISKESLQAAKRVGLKIVKTTKSLHKNTERFAKEHYIEIETSNIRSVVVWSYKIIYEVTDSKVIILDVFHTSRNPEEIKKIKS